MKEYRFSLRFIEIDGNKSEAILLKFPGDVYIEIGEAFDSEDYAIEMLVWAENAVPGDFYSDENIVLRAL